MSVPYDVGRINLPVVKYSDREIVNLLAIKGHYPKLVVPLEDILLTQSYSSALPAPR